MESGCQYDAQNPAKTNVRGNLSLLFSCVLIWKTHVSVLQSSDSGWEDEEKVTAEDVTWVTRLVDEGKAVDVVYLGYSKAFDSLSQSSYSVLVRVPSGVGRAGAASAPCSTPGPLVLTGTGRLCQGSEPRAGEGRAPSSAPACLWPLYSTALSPWSDAELLPLSDVEQEAVDFIQANSISKEMDLVQKLQFLNSICILCSTAGQEGLTLSHDIFCLLKNQCKKIEVLLCEEPMEQLSTGLRYCCMNTIAALRYLPSPCFCQHIPRAPSWWP
ncbi:uncharacterized protein LOC116653180 [Coturnix japonica]|uniref:uncharacterized protein LOC116653180 n=1 Tax=Coturnix japonica TaxID=93934 RepID=UPI0013A5CB0E|nr:uncharacterized protein LOC116653180 [Coturnix japonica]